MPSFNTRLPRVAALGYYGFQNLGDEAVLAGIRAALQESVGDTDFLVLSANPSATMQMHKGVRAAPRWKLRDLPAALAGTDLFILGGGSLLQDATSAKSVLWYALAAMVARRKSKRVLWWAQGVGPLGSSVSRRLVRVIGNQADAITVRDEKSASLLKAIGVRGSIETVADAAFALPAPEQFPPQSAVVALRPWRENGWVKTISGSNMAARFAKATGDTITAFPMHLPDDADFARAYFGDTAKVHYGDWTGQTIESVLGDFSRAKIVVAMRLHALIFAAKCGVPFVALSYDPKVDALAHTAQQEDALLSVNNMTEEAFFETVGRVLATAPARREQLQLFAETQAKRAKRPADIAAQWLRNG